MAITEQTRHDLHQRLDEVLGTQEATTLMEHLPPVGWADVATKADLVLLKTDLHAIEERIDALEERLELRFDSKLDRALREQTRTLIFANIGYLLAFGSMLIAAAKL